MPHRKRLLARAAKYSSEGTNVNDLGESLIAAANTEPVEGVLYRVTYIERSLGVEKTMTARYGGRTQGNGRWLPVWILDPIEQFGHAVGSIGPVVSAEIVHAGGSES